MSKIERPINDASGELSRSECVTLGALGGVVVAFATYPASQDGYNDLLLNRDLFEWVGFLIRAAGCAALGAIWGYIHRPETDRRRAFQLGLVAPATLAGIVYANPDASPPQANSQVQQTPVVAYALAAADTAAMTTARMAVLSDVDLRIFVQGGPQRPDPRPVSDRLLKGVFGR